MKKRKENSPNFPVIGSRRTKASPVKIKNSILPTGLRDQEPAYLEIKATPEDWHKLETFWADDLDGFCQEILRSFIEPAITEIEKDTTRGRHKPYRTLADTIKNESSWLYAFLKYWLKKDKRPYPDYLNQLIEMTEKEFGDARKTSLKSLFTQSTSVKKEKEDTNYDIVLLTQFTIEMIHGDEAKKQNLIPFDNSESFFQTYCLRANRIYKSFIFGKGVKDDPDYVESLVYKIPALNSVFKTLKLI